MNKINFRSLVGSVLIFIVLFLPATVYAQGIGGEDTQVILGGTYQLDSGNSLEGDLLIVGGQGTLQDNSIVNGDVFIIGGTLKVNGRINGEIVSIGGSISLEDGAYLTGDINTIGGTIHLSDKAKVLGRINEDSKPQLKFSIPFRSFFTENQPPIQYPYSSMFFELIQGVFGKISTTVVQSLAMSILGVLIILFMIKPVERIASAVLYRPFISAGLGLMTLIVTPALIMILLITIILSPLGILGALAIFAGLLLGWVAIGYEIGKRLSVLFKTVWAPPISAGIGTLILTLVASGIGWIPCFGWIAPFFISIIGLGAVLMSRFGTLLYSPLNEITYAQPDDFSNAGSNPNSDAIIAKPVPPVDLSDPFEPEFPSAPTSEIANPQVLQGKSLEPRKRRSSKNNGPENPGSEDKG